MSFSQILITLCRGAGYTVLVTLACIATGLFSGLLLAVLGRLQSRYISGVIAAYVFVFRGVPMLVLLFTVFFGLPAIGLNVPPLLSMMLSLGLISGAYLSEVFRGALNAIDPNELLAANAMGLGPLQIFVWIEMPQMLRFAAPGMINEFTTVLKYSPFAYTIGIPEIMKEATSLVSVTMNGGEIYAAAGVLYFAIYRLLVAAVRVVEHRYRVPGMSGYQAGTHGAS